MMTFDLRWRLSVMMLLEYPIWGAWTPVLSSYLGDLATKGGLGLDTAKIGVIYSLLPLGFAIVNATNPVSPNPIVITTAGKHGLPPSGQFVTISGVSGNTGANGLWQILSVTANTFTLNNGVGNSIHSRAQELSDHHRGIVCRSQIMRRRLPTFPSPTNLVASNNPCTNGLLIANIGAGSYNYCLIEGNNFHSCTITKTSLPGTGNANGVNVNNIT